jgi:hypothetical protein
MALMKEINRHSADYKIICFVGTQKNIKKSIGPDKPAIESYAEKVDPSLHICDFSL